MTRALGLLGCVSLSCLLTGCPLTDPYRLLSELAGAPGAGASAGAEPTAGTNSVGRGGAASAGSSPGGMSSELAGAEDSGGSSPIDGGGGNAVGDAGESAFGGGPSGGSAGFGGSSGAATAGASGSAGFSGSSGSSDTAGTSGIAGTSGAGSAGAGGSAGAVGCVAPCGALLSCCSTTCVDTTASAQHCGGCGKACNQGRTCSASTCKSGWVSMKAPPVGTVARSRAASVAMGKSVFIWGGLDGAGAAMDNGLIYRPATDSWVTLPKDTGSPSARSMASAVWTGSVVVVYGGMDATGTVLKDGAVYDPANNSWVALPIPPSTVVLSRRSAPYGYFDGTRAVFWGGLTASNLPVAGADRFDLTSWSTSTASGDPGGISSAALAFDGSTLYLQGGIASGFRQDRVFSYSNSADKWSTLSKSLSARSGAFAAWDGARFLVWGGRDDAGLRNDGKYLSGTLWTSLATFGAPSARYISFRRSGWSFQVRPGVVAMLGGQTSLVGTGTLATGGATYDVASTQWVAIPDWPSAESHEYGIGVWTGEEFVLWGGRDANVPTLGGERWAPP